MHHTHWCIVFVSYHNNVFENYIGSVYVGICCGRSKSGLCVFGNFYQVCNCSSVLLHSIVMLYVDCGDDVQVVRCYDTVAISGDDVCCSVVLWLVCLCLVFSIFIHAVQFTSETQLIYTHLRKIYVKDFSQPLTINPFVPLAHPPN